MLFSPLPFRAHLSLTSKAQTDVASWLRTDRCGEEEEEEEREEREGGTEGGEGAGEAEGEGGGGGEVEGRGRGGYRDSRPMHRREGMGTTDWDIEDSRPEREVHVVPDRGV